MNGLSGLICCVLLPTGQSELGARKAVPTVRRGECHHFARFFDENNFNKRKENKEKAEREMEIVEGIHVETISESTKNSG